MTSAAAAAMQKVLISTSPQDWFTQLVFVERRFAKSLRYSGRSLRSHLSDIGPCPRGIPDLSSGPPDNSRFLRGFHPHNSITAATFGKLLVLVCKLRKDRLHCISLGLGGPDRYVKFGGHCVRVCRIRQNSVNEICPVLHVRAFVRNCSQEKIVSLVLTQIDRYI